MKIILLLLILTQTVFADKIKDLREEKIDLGKGIEIEFINVQNKLWVAKYETTQEQWLAVMGKGEMYRTAPWLQAPEIRGDRKPMDNVSWEIAQAFCARLSKRAGESIRLPTEKEWDFFSNGTELEDAVCSLGSKKSRLQPCDVGDKRPNRFGLHDVRGNVMEICSGLWKEYKDPKTGKVRTDNPTITWGKADSSAILAPVRGGCYWMNSPKMMEINFRDYAIPCDAKSVAGVGFRVVMDK